MQLTKEQYEILKKLDSGYHLYLVGHTMWRLSKGNKNEPIASKNVEELLGSNVLEPAAASSADPMEFVVKGNLSDYSMKPSQKPN